ncbi:LysR family transcriptional regulator [Marinomonas agarivorans]|nr:LysR family transcriptional regulator [Marinomonas agarivorans]
MYSINDLETFVAIARSGGISAASRLQGISVATISHRLGKLEHALKVPLFHRSNKAMHLNKEGQMFLERVEKILEELHDAQTTLTGKPDQLHGHLRVTMSPWIMRRFVMPYLAGFQQTHPDLTLELLATDQIVPLAEEMQDCAIRVGQLPDSTLVAHKLADNQRILCASPDYIERIGPIDNIATLQQAHWVCLPWQTRFQIKLANSPTQSVLMSKKLIVSNSDMLTTGAIYGNGLAIKSRLAIEKELQNKQLMEVLPTSLINANAPISLIYPSNTRSVRKMQVFKQFLQQAFSH